MIPNIYTLSLHDALPISNARFRIKAPGSPKRTNLTCFGAMDAFPPVPRKASLPPALRGTGGKASIRSEEHTSELQSLRHLVCRLLLEKKKKLNQSNNHE